MNHNIYGTQLRVSSHRVKEPEDLVSIERYLGSGAVKGVGAALAARIVRRFKEDIFRIIEEEPERLAEIKGISERKAREIAIQVEEKKEMRKAMLFLQKIWHFHHVRCKNLRILRCETLSGVGRKSLSAGG